MKKIGMLFLLGTLILLTGCGKEAENSVKSDKMEGASTTAKGRYLEHQVELPSMFSMEKGVYFLMKKAEGVEVTSVVEGESAYIPNKEGVSATIESDPWLAAFTGYHYVPFFGKSEAGEIIMEYVDYEKEEDNGKYKPSYLYRKANGEEIKLEIPLEGNSWIVQFVFLEDGRLVGSDLDGNVYWVEKETGELTKILQSPTQSPAILLEQTKDYLLVITEKEELFYDLKNEEIIETEQILYDFLKKEDVLLGGRSAILESHFLLSGTNQAGEVYVATRSGVYRYVVGGSLVEQVIDGMLCSLGDLSKQLVRMEVFPTGEIYILFSGGALMKYQFDENASTVPEKTLHIFSMEDNPTVRQTISQFQKKNQDIYVKYEIGRSIEGGLNDEDIIRRINTEWLNGNGADIYILDDMNRKNYEEKGMLLDIADVLKEMEGEVFKSITNCFETQGKVYSIPTKASIPLLFGNKEVIEQMKTIESMANTLEELRKQKVETSFFGLRNEEELLEVLYVFYGNKLVGENGIKEDEVKKFVTYAKKICENENFIDEVKTEATQAFSMMNLDGKNIIQYLLKKQYLIGGMLNGTALDYANVCTLKKQKEGSDFAWLKGEAGGNFIPRTMVSINAHSKMQKEAKEWIKIILDKEVQKNVFGDGISVNKESASLGMKFNGMSYALGVSGDSGETIQFDVEEATSLEKEELLEFMEAANEPIEIDLAMKAITLEITKSAINGDKEVDEVVREIKNRMQIRLQE